MQGFFFAWRMGGNGRPQKAAVFRQHRPYFQYMEVFYCTHRRVFMKKQYLVLPIAAMISVAVLGCGAVHDAMRESAAPITSNAAIPPSGDITAPEFLRHSVREWQGGDQGCTRQGQHCVWGGAYRKHSGKGQYLDQRKDSSVIAALKGG